MTRADETLEKLLTIEKAVNEMTTPRQGIVELKELENARQKALDDLRTKENRYRTIFENLLEKFAMKDKNFVYTFCTEKFAADLERKPIEIIGKSDQDLFSIDVAAKYREEDKRIMETGILKDTEELSFRGGSPIVLRRVKTLLKEEKGEILGILTICSDITYQRRKEEEFQKKAKGFEDSLASFNAELRRKDNIIAAEIVDRKRSEERLQRGEGFQKILEHLPVPILLLEGDGIVSMANAAFERLSGDLKGEI